MAKNKSSIYLGFEDEEINEKNRILLNYCVNKIGGHPDWVSNYDIKIPYCPICSLNRPLIAQIYAPLDNSQFHRTLYVFGCLNPQCSVQSRSWVCIRVQGLDCNEMQSTITMDRQAIKKVSTKSSSVIWCSGSDDWDDDTTANMNTSWGEENGNVLNRNYTKNENDNIHHSDDDDESNSLENDSINGCFGNLNITEDPNANCPIQGAQGGILNSVGKLLTSPSQQFYAEIEGEESELVTMESPIKPERDLTELLKQSSGFPKVKLTNLALKSFFLYVEQEPDTSMSNNYFGIQDHVRELIQEYQQRDDIQQQSDLAAGGINVAADQEFYEKSIPAHGDILFHNFTTIIQNNPGQILRYSRNAAPLLISALSESLPKCSNCGSETICELQILPTLIPRLKLENSEPAPIEFGNILIFTCLNSCWDTPDKMRYETVVIQKEL